MHEPIHILTDYFFNRYPVNIMPVGRVISKSCFSGTFRRYYGLTCVGKVINGLLSCFGYAGPDRSFGPTE
ncbi:hypothetical protein [Anaerobacterium chartisolvens]|nr:hypothetical protein [Anaerobacterium chartisolvens]